jgi:hypothetical protein
MHCLAVLVSHRLVWSALCRPCAAQNQTQSDARRRPQTGALLGRSCLVTVLCGQLFAATSKARLIRWLQNSIIHGFEPRRFPLTSFLDCFLLTIWDLEGLLLTAVGVMPSEQLGRPCHVALCYIEPEPTTAAAARPCLMPGPGH